MPRRLRLDGNRTATAVATGLAVGSAACWRYTVLRERRLIDALSGMSEATSRLPDMREHVCDCARRALGADVDVLFVPSDGHLISTTVTGADLPALRIPLDHPESVIARAFREQQMIFVHRGELFELPVLREIGARAALAAPVTRVGFRFGVNVWLWQRSKRRLSARERSLARFFANEKGMTIQHADALLQAAELTRTQVRARVARDLHDSVVQELAVMSIYAETAADALAGHPEVLPEVLPEIASHATRAHEEMRDLLDALRLGRPLVELDLADLVDTVAADFRQRRPGVALAVDISAADRRDVRPAVREAVYFVLREALNNVASHADARTVGVHLERGPGGVWMVVRDDGRGFDPAGVQERRLGLIGMRERAQLADGRLEVDSAPGHGTTVTLHVDDPGLPPAEIRDVWPAEPAA
ncbi:MAG: two-component sensor histidine kinase [Conexibacter sp.]|nr:two-component sensor histidine kinase [Conexibacter sp.]